LFQKKKKTDVASLAKKIKLEENKYGEKENI
jgi:hypothetical protein